MSVRVLLPNAFQKHTDGTREIQSSAGNLPQLISEIETKFPALRSHLRDDQGQVRRFINFYVNEEDIRFLGNEKYSFRDGDEVLVIPSIAGGCCAQGSLPDGQRASRFSLEDGGSLCSCCSYCGQENCICGD
jgi:sulfur-carrier protein